MHSDHPPRLLMRLDQGARPFPAIEMHQHIGDPRRYRISKTLALKKFLTETVLRRSPRAMRDATARSNRLQHFNQLDLALVIQGEVMQGHLYYAVPHIHRPGRTSNAACLGVAERRQRMGRWLIADPPADFASNASRRAGASPI